jgi:hypothetical protein
MLSKHLKSIGWTDADLEYWDQGLEQSFKHGVFGSYAWNNSCTIWYHYSPDLIEIADDAEYNWSGGPPYRWNKYDTNPALNDTDGDMMDDNWDPRPLMVDDRLDAYIAITKIEYQNNPYTAQAPTNKNFTTGFNANFTALEVSKGEEITLTLWLGLEKSPPTGNEVINNWWQPMNISIWFGTFLLGADNASHGDLVGDDFRGDDIWPDINNTGLPRAPDKPWVTVGTGNHKGQRTFFNSTGVSSTMEFYEQIITIYLPANLPAGIIGFIVRANPNTGENFYYESSTWPFVGY